LYKPEKKYRGMPKEIDVNNIQENEK